MNSFYELNNIATLLDGQIDSAALYVDGLLDAAAIAAFSPVSYHVPRIRACEQH